MAERQGECVIMDRAIVILDESSMLDLGLLERTLDRAIERGASVLAIGDRAQLIRVPPHGRSRTRITTGIHAWRAGAP